MEEEVPKHIAIIMDGNGRWAKAQGRERLYGHIHGVDSIRAVVKGALTRGVEYLTLYAFSTENWGRPNDEVEGLMELLCKSAVNETPELKTQGVRIEFIGDESELSEEVKKAIKYCRDETEANNKLTLVIALNYSSRNEITNAVKDIAARVSKGEITVESIDNELITKTLYTKNIPDPDLIIRTSGEQRLSNFLLWQAAYTEFYFTPVYWPDFNETELDKAIAEYSRRNRRFGLIF